MKFEFSTDAQGLIVRFYGDRRGAVVFHQVAAVLALGLVYLLIFRDPDYLNASLRIIGKTAGFSWLTFNVLRQQFSVCSLVITDATVTLERRLFGMGRKRTFPRNDIERLGYEAGDQYDDAALAVMVRTVMMPIRFAHGMPPEEATQVFDEIHANSCWIGNLIRPVGVPMF